MKQSIDKQSADDQRALDGVREQIQQKHFSQEMIAREIYYLFSESDIGKAKNEMIFFQFARDQISQGQPLELIDGDNLQFLARLGKLLKDFEQNEEPTLVVSVIGP